MTTTRQKSSEGIKRRVLVPFTLALILTLSLFVYLSDNYLQNLHSRDLAQRLKTVDTLFKVLLDQRIQLINAATTQIAKDKELQRAFHSGDRNTLLQLAQPIFTPLQTEHRISHFYFHTSEGVNFLRVHQPGRFGDRIERYTMMQAIDTGKSAHGIELGPLGTFTLRSVFPWVVNDTLIGYIELGEEIDPIIRRLHEIGHVELIVFIRKNFLTRQGWEEGMRMLGRPAKWDDFPNQVVIGNTLPEMPPQLAQQIPDGKPINGREIVLDFSGRSYRGRQLALRDVTKEAVGDFLILRDVTEDLLYFQRNLQQIVFFSIFLGTTLFLSTFIVLGRVEKRLRRSRAQLIGQMETTQQAKELLETEMDERHQAEIALKKSHNELEQRVLERTADLNESLTDILQEKNRLKGIIDSVDDVLIVTDSRDQILKMNRNAEILFGTTQEEAAGRGIEYLIKDPQLLEQMTAALKERTAGVLFDFETAGAEEDRPRTMQMRSSYLSDAATTYGGMIFLGHDVSRERRMDQAKSEFISTAAHELRTPMATILGFSELLSDHNGFTAKEKQEFSDLIHEKADSLSLLLDDLLDISRIESGKELELFKVSLTVKELIEPMILHYRKMVREHEIKIDLDKPESMLCVDQGKMGQVMENLLGNAVKYSPEGGTLHITGETTTAGYQISVADQGIGMTPEQVDKIFEKFYRADASDVAIRGTGLGMTIVKNIVEAHDGTISVESEPGQGTRVSFTIPLAK